MTTPVSILLTALILILLAMILCIAPVRRRLIVLVLPFGSGRLPFSFILRGTLRDVRLWLTLPLLAFLVVHVGLGLTDRPFRLASFADWIVRRSLLTLDALAVVAILRRLRVRMRNRLVKSSFNGFRLWLFSAIGLSLFRWNRLSDGPFAVIVPQVL